MALVPARQSNLNGTQKIKIKKNDAIYKKKKIDKSVNLFLFYENITYSGHVKSFPNVDWKNLEPEKVCDLWYRWYSFTLTITIINEFFFLTGLIKYWTS